MLVYYTDLSNNRNMSFFALLLVVLVSIAVEDHLRQKQLDKAEEEDPWSSLL